MPISPFPPHPSRSDPATFADKADAYLAHLESPFVAQANALEANVNAKEASATLSAANALASANAASNTANVTAWVSGTTYDVGANVWDPVNFMTYRNMTVGGSLTTRPGEDFAKAKWQLVSGQGDVTMAGTQTITGLKSFTVSPWVPTAPTETSTLIAASTAYVANRVQEYAVTLTGNQTIGGVKTWSDWQGWSASNQISGYTTGAGTSVTQLTSKSTNTPSFNVPCGTIITHNQALAAGASVQFSVPSTRVTPGGCVVIINPTNTASYSAFASITSGGFIVRLTNVTAGSLSEAVTLSVAILRIATN